MDVLELSISTSSCSTTLSASVDMSASSCQSDLKLDAQPDDVHRHPRCFLLAIPTEVQEHIFNYCGIAALHKLVSTCHDVRWNLTAGDCKHVWAAANPTVQSVFLGRIPLVAYTVHNKGAGEPAAVSLEQFWSSTQLSQYKAQKQRDSSHEQLPIFRPKVFPWSGFRTHQHQMWRMCVNESLAHVGYLHRIEFLAWMDLYRSALEKEHELRVEELVSDEAAWCDSVEDIHDMHADVDGTIFLQDLRSFSGATKPLTVIKSWAKLMALYHGGSFDFAVEALHQFPFELLSCFGHNQQSERIPFASSLAAKVLLPDTHEAVETMRSYWRQTSLSHTSPQPLYDFLPLGAVELYNNVISVPGASLHVSRDVLNEVTTFEKPKRKLTNLPQAVGARAVYKKHSTWRGKIPTESDKRVRRQMENTVNVTCGGKKGTQHADTTIAGTDARTCTWSKKGMTPSQHRARFEAKENQTRGKKLFT